jgi:hypothetical protein
MKREPWAIGNTFAYAVRVLNSIFCMASDGDSTGCSESWSADDREASGDIHWLVAEQINSMCSDMMIEDAQDMLKMVQSIPTGRLCERMDCHFHHPPNPNRSSYVDVSGAKCRVCPYNTKCKVDVSKRQSHYSPD